MGRIIVAGSINMDVVSRMERMPKAGETIFGDELHFIPGGKGANQAVAASRLNGRVSFLGRVGEDDFGRLLYNFLKRENIDVSAIRHTKDVPTGTAIIWVNRNAQNSIVVIPGSNGKVSEKDIEALGISQADIVLSQFEIPLDTVFALFKRAKGAGATTILNPAPAIKCPEELLKLTDYLIVNEHEAAFFAGGETTDKLEEIADYSNKIKKNKDQVIIITLGANGVFCNAAEQIRVEGIRVKAIDTTAAGDCFAGAFAVALSEQKSLRDALNFANKAASISVQKLGASSSLPTRKEVDI